MALHVDTNGKVQIVTPPKTLTNDEKKILEKMKVNEALVHEAVNTKFNVVYG
ncbi:MAG: hypothetical protein NTZ60_12290 [Campylobacterales bacterium]|nr:hypothetical protein [Campylobacterales bacterium]